MSDSGRESGVLSPPLKDLFEDFFPKIKMFAFPLILQVVG